MNIQKELSKTIQEFQSMGLAQKRIKKLEVRLDESYDQLEDLMDVLEKEYEDVRQLEELSMNLLFRKILGNKEKQLEKERQEYLEAALKYNEFKKTVELIEYEKELIDKKLESYNVVKSKLNSLIRQRERELLQTNQTARLQLTSINNVIDKNLRIKRELHEALLVGAKVQDFFIKMEEQLMSAIKWGDWNTFDHSSSMRDMSIDNATKLAYQVKELLIHFEEELEDVFAKKKLSWTYDLSDGKKFTNLYFKNLISDWIIQKKIITTQRHTTNFKDKVIRINTSLKYELKQMTTAIKYLEDKKRKLVLELN